MYLPMPHRFCRRTVFLHFHRPVLSGAVSLQSVSSTLLSPPVMAMQEDKEIRQRLFGTRCFNLLRQGSLACRCPCTVLPGRTERATRELSVTRLVARWLSGSGSGTVRSRPAPATQLCLAACVSQLPRVNKDNGLAAAASRCVRQPARSGLDCHIENVR